MLTIFEWVPKSVSQPVGSVIANSPEAAYELSGSGIDYQVFENLELDRQLFENETEYFQLQKQWLTRLDFFIQSRSPDAARLNLKLASSNYLRLKYLLDSAYLEVRTAQILLRQFKPSCLRVYRKVSPAFSSIFSFVKAEGRPFFYQALELLCQAQGIAFEAVNQLREVPAEGKNLVEPTLRVLFKRVMKCFYFFFKYRKPLFTRFKRSSPGNLFLHAGSGDVDEFIKSAFKLGKRVLTTDRFGIYNETLFRPLTPFKNLNKETESTYISQFTTIAAEFDSNSINFYDFFDRECTQIAFKLVKPCIANFIKHDCPRILSLIDSYQSVLAQCNLETVFARGNTDMDSISLLLAARHACGIKTVCIQHASCGLLSESMSVYDANTYDLTLARDEVSQASMSEAWTRHEGESYAVVVSAHYLNSVAKKKGGQSPCLPYKRVLYVEKKFAGHLRGFNENMYSLNDYYDFQKKVLNLFARHPETHFVYKHAVGQSWAEHSILHDIRRRSLKNVEIAACDFIVELASADAVIVDYPSGSLFESIAARVPVVSVYPDYFQISNRAKDTLGAILQPFSDSDHAVCAMEAFLSESPEKYLASLSLNADFDSVWAEIEKIRKKI